MIANDLGIYDRDAASWWNLDSPAFRSLHSVHAYRLERLEQWLASCHASLRGMRAVDVGCGGGIVSARLGAAGASVVGVDRSMPSLLAATAGCRPRTTGWIRADAGAIPLADGVADIALLCDVLEHVAAPEIAIREAARVVRPGGFVFVSTLNRTKRARWLAIGIAERIGLIPRGTHDARLFIRPAELVGWSVDAGLRVARVEGEGVRVLRTVLRRRIVPCASRSTAVAYQALFRKGGDPCDA